MFRYYRLKLLGQLITFMGALLLFFSYIKLGTPWILAISITLLGAGILLYAYFVILPHAIQNEEELE